MGPEVAFDNFASGNETCNNCPPTNKEVLELVMTCLQFFNEIWRINGKNEEFRREIDKIILKIINNVSELMP